MKTHTELRRLIDQKDKQIAKAKKIRNEYFDELRRICPHEKTTAKRNYWEGSYFDHATTKYWDECDCCGMELNKKTVEHDWYGE